MKRLLQTLMVLFLSSYLPAFAKSPLPGPTSTAIPQPTSTPLPTPEPTPAPPSVTRDQFFFSLGAPLMFSYNTYPPLDPKLNSGWTSEVPNGAWSNGMAANVGFEKALDDRFSLQLEAGLVTMDINQLLVESWDTPPRRTGATLFTSTLDIKVRFAPGKPVQPYFCAGLGISAIRISQLLVYQSMTVVPEYNGARLTTLVAAGLDVPWDEGVTAFFEFQFDDMDTLNLLAVGPDVSLALFRMGLRLAD